MEQLQWLRIFFLVTLSALLTPSWAVISTNKFWSLLTLSGNYGKFLYNIEPQLRLIDAHKPFNQFLTNMGGGLQAAPAWQFWLGQTISAISLDIDPGNFGEYRIWEQIIWQRQKNSVRFNSRTRLEQRKLSGFPEWANRIRERLLVTIPLKTNFSLAVSNEILVNLNHVPWITAKTWDQNRAYVGVVQQLSASTSLNVGYMNQRIFTQVIRSDNVLVINVQINLAT